MKSEGLHTVCQEAGCPNIFECWEDREATFLIGGDQCTRRCDFCQIDTGKPAAARPRRAAPGRRVACARWGCATPPSPASPATTCPTAAPGCTPRPCEQIHELNPDTGVENLIPDFNGKPDLLQRGLRVPPRGARPQRRDRPADLQADPAGVPLRPLAGRAHPGPRVRPGHQVQPDPRHGRDPRGGLPGAARPARGRLRADHDHPVPPPLPAAPPGRAVGQARGVRGAQGRGRRDRLRRRHVRAAGALVVPRRAALHARRWRPARPPQRSPPDPGRTPGLRESPVPSEQNDRSSRGSPDGQEGPVREERGPAQADRPRLPDDEEDRPPDRSDPAGRLPGHRARRLRRVLARAGRLGLRRGHRACCSACWPR